MYTNGKYGNGFSMPKGVNEKSVSSVGVKNNIPAAKTNQTGKDSMVKGKDKVSIPKC
jgi:hypothetical protein